MKKVRFAATILGLILLGACRQNSGNQAQSITGSECYTAYYGSDSASLNFRHTNGRIEGNLNLYFAGKDNLTGKIRGNFVGDTLFADYTYRRGESNRYDKSQVVFLRKNAKLYQGYGELANTYGLFHFNRKSPIDFDNGFAFFPSDCE